MEDGFALKEATVGIIGLGLMGGSLALALRGQCARLIGFDSDPKTLELALSKGIIDQADHSALSGAGAQSKRIDLLILATPVPIIIALLQKLPSLISHPCIVMDLGSTKQTITQAMAALPERFDPVGGHPICGKEKLGLANAEATLFQNTPFVITPLARTTQRAKSAARQLITILRANLIEMAAEEHDRILAATSHLPFLIASALAACTPPEFDSLIGSGFRSTSRLAGTPSSMMLGVMKSNRENVLQALQQFQQRLSSLENALQQEGYGELEVILDRSRSCYLALLGNR